jgi:hypothetical protein
VASAGRVTAERSHSPCAAMSQSAWLSRQGPQSPRHLLVPGSRLVAACVARGPPQVPGPHDLWRGARPRGRYSPPAAGVTTRLLGQPVTSRASSVTIIPEDGDAADVERRDAPIPVPYGGSYPADTKEEWAQVVLESVGTPPEFAHVVASAEGVDGGIDKAAPCRAGDALGGVVVVRVVQVHPVADAASSAPPSPSGLRPGIPRPDGKARGPPPDPGPQSP